MDGLASKLQTDEIALVKELKLASKNARKAPWGQGEMRKEDHKGSYTVYKVRRNEEELIIKMRNNIDELISIIERLSK